MTDNDPLLLILDNAQQLQWLSSALNHWVVYANPDENAAALALKIHQQVEDPSQRIEAPRFDSDVWAILTKAPVEWSAIADGMNSTQIDNLARSLCYIAQQVARLAGYFQGRNLFKNHAKSVKDANKAVAALRPGLGYTQRRDDISF